MIGLIAQHKLVLATGHSSPTEVLLLIREAKRQGVEHIVITHPMSASVKMNVSQMQEAAKMGAFLDANERFGMVGGRRSGTQTPSA